MATLIKCPKCSNEFPLEEAMAEEYKKDLREKMMVYKKEKDEELEKKDREWQKKLAEKDKEQLLQLQKEKDKFRNELEATLRKSITSDFENKLQLLERNDLEKEEKLRQARIKEMEFLKKEMDMKNREAELELNLQRMLQLEREKITQEVVKIEQQKNEMKETDFMLKLKEKDKQLEAQKKLVEEMKRKQDQVSMQLQGEVQELALEELLKVTFPFDMITEVGKGIKGADCIQTVRNSMGQECGTIIYESKRRQGFNKEWIEKLKKDMRHQKADIAVIVTSVMPKDMDCFGLKEGIWICSFSEVKAMASVLRDGVIRIYNSSKSHENKGDKINMLYDYLISNEFSEKWKAMREGFKSIYDSIQKEKDVMEKLWASRKKQLEKILYNSNDIKGSIEGISGNDSINMNLLESGENNL